MGPKKRRIQRCSASSERLPTKRVSKGKGPEAGISLVHSRKIQKEASMSVECQPRKMYWDIKMER